jgi:phage-related protein
MASKQEKLEAIKARQVEQANEMLSDQINLVAQLNDRLKDLLGPSKERNTLDNLSLQITKEAIRNTKSLKSEYNSVEEIAKERNKQLNNEQSIQKQILAATKEGGEAAAKEVEIFKAREASLAKSAEKLAKAQQQEALGVKGAKELVEQAEALYKKKQAQFDISASNLSKQAEEIVYLEQAKKIQEENIKYLDQELQKQENINKAMGFLGRGAEGVGKTLNKWGLGALAKPFDSYAKKARETATVMTEGGTKSLTIFQKVGIAMKGMAVAALALGAAIASALNPVALISKLVGAISNAYEKGKEAAKRLSDENTQIGRTLGVSQSKAEELAVSARKIGTEMGITGGQATQSATAIYDALGGAEKLSDKTLNTFMRLNVFAGMSAESIKDIQHLSKLTGSDAGKVADAMARTAQESIKSMKVNVSMKQVMEGVGKVSNIMKLNFGGSAEGLTKAFLQSKKLGLELDKVADIANSLLNFEDSISAEMEAELLTGKDLNLEKAREAALNHDNVALMEEIGKQFGSIEDFQKMNTLQQDAFAKSIGMSRENLADMLVTSKENVANNTDMVSEQDKSLKAMETMATVGEKMQAQEEARANQFAKIFELLNPIVQAFKDLGPLILDLITPLVESLVPVLNDVAHDILPIIKDIFKGIGPLIGMLVKAVMPFVTQILNLAKDLLPPIMDAFKILVPIIAKIIKSFQPFIDAVMQLIKDLLPVVTELLAGIMDALAPIIELAGELAKVLFPAIVGILKSIMPVLMPIFKIFEGIAQMVTGILQGDWSKVGDGLKKIGEGILNLLIGLVEGTINLLITAINSILDFIPGVDANTIPKVTLPKVKLAEGGIVDKPTNALIGEAGPEAVIPLNSNKANGVLGNNDTLVKEFQEMKQILTAILNKNSVITLDGNKMGTAMAVGSYRIQ